MSSACGNCLEDDTGCIIESTLEFPVWTLFAKHSVLSMISRRELQAMGWFGKWGFRNLGWGWCCGGAFVNLLIVENLDS